MPTELLKRVNWSQIYPPFMEKCFALAAACQKAGADYYAISGYRSFEDQAKLYFQGRTAPGKIVTNASPGLSAHNYGLAVDWCRDADVTRDGLQMDWNLADYERLATEAEHLGLEPGLHWKTFREGPHVQLHLSAKNITLTMLRGIHARGGVPAVWAFLDENGPW